MIDFSSLGKERQEAVALAVIIICPGCDSRVMAMGPALQEVSCPNCNRIYSRNTRKVMRECYERNTAHKG